MTMIEKRAPTAPADAVTTDRAADVIAAGRVDLAAALRLSARLGYHEGICNHYSLLVPGTRDRFIINPYGLHWSQMRASDLLVSDAEGRVIAGAEPPEPTAFFIHSRVHLANPHAACVLHTHMPYATALTTLAQGRLEWISQNSARFYGRVAYYDEYDGLALDASEGDRIAEALGDNRILFMANHGVVSVGPSVARAFDDLYYLERACQLQVIAMQTGRPLRRLSEAVLAKTAAQFDTTAEFVGRHFAALKRVLDREEPDYAD